MYVFEGGTSVALVMSRALSVRCDAACLFIAVYVFSLEKQEKITRQKKKWTTPDARFYDMLHLALTCLMSVYSGAGIVGDGTRLGEPATDLIARNNNS